MEKGLPIGVAPNIHVSLVLLPDECRSLSERSFPLQTLKLKLLGQAAKVLLEPEHPRGGVPRRGRRPRGVAEAVTRAARAAQAASARPQAVRQRSARGLGSRRRP